ncbi:MAG: TspO/MBR family protein [archaeon]
MFSIVICELAGVVGSIFTIPALPEWYAALQKPSFAPSGTVIGPVWIILYFMMGVALYLVLKKYPDGKIVKTGLLLFALQLVLNVFWSVVFFGLKSPFYAVLEIISLWFAILLTIYMFFKIDRRAAYLLVPYIIWVSFAAVLNYQIWMLNA